MLVRGVSVDPATLQTVLRRGQRSDAVRTLQDLLKAHGFLPGPSDGDFGGETQRAVAQFQQAHNLGADGAVGPRTWAELVGDTLPAERPERVVVDGSTRAQELLAVTVAELGVSEDPDGSNSGARVDTYTHNLHVPWCAYFVSWCLEQMPWNPWPKRFGAVIDIHAWAVRQKLYAARYTGAWPQVGNLFVLLYPTGEHVDIGHGHVGFVLSYDNVRQTIRTVEGNASNAVRSYTRNCRDVTGWVRITEGA